MKRSLDLPIRIREVEIKNFKNVNKGKIVFIKNKNKEPYENIIGLYGQNGSGKTTFVNTLDIIKAYIADEVVVFPFVNRISDFYDYLSINADKSDINVKFDILIKNKPVLVNYCLSFLRNSSVKQYILNKEKIEFQYNNKKSIISYQNKKGHMLSDDMRELLSDEYINTQFKLAEGMSNKTSQSAIFNEIIINALRKKFNDLPLTEVLSQLKIFAKFDMFVITNKQFGMINLQWNLPFTFRYSKNKEVVGLDSKKMNQEELTSGSQIIDLRQPQLVPVSFYEKLVPMISTINEVLTRLIPHTQIEIIANECILANGQSGKSIELVTNRDGFKIPMRNESTGILKIISIIQTLIAYCTYDDIFVAIDELDAGIFEYLLGNLLGLLSKEGKGQLFFSSHNLRPLEILNKNCIYFSTSNPLNRYIKMSNVKKNNNLRDFYLRTVELGGQKEFLYNDDDMAGLEIILKRMEKNG